MKHLIGILSLIFLSGNLWAQNNDFIIETLEFKVPVTAVNVSPDGNWLLAGMENGDLHIYDIKSLAEKRLVEGAAGSAIFDIEMSPSMDVILLASGNRITLLDTTGVKINTWVPHKNTMWCMDIDKDGKYVVSTEVNKTFQLTNVYEGVVEQAMRGHDDITLAVEFSPDGKYIASGSHDRKVHLWCMETKEIVATYQGIADYIYDVAFSPDGNLIAACSRDKSVRIWNLETGDLVHILKGHQDMVLEIEFSPNGKYLLSSSVDQSIRLWDVASGEELYAYLENGSSIPDIVFLPGGTSFASAGMDQALRIWEVSPEIFVVKYYGKEFREELSKNHLFDERYKGEKKADYESRMERAATARAKIVDTYYKRYLEEHP